MTLRLLRVCMLLPCLGALQWLPGQVLPFSDGSRKVPLMATDLQTTVVSARSTATMSFVADPSVYGGDAFVVRVTDPGLAISVVLPSGLEVTADNADSLGFDYSISTVTDPGKLAGTLFGDPGTYVVILLPAAQVPGAYTIRANGTALSTESAMVATYQSSSGVGLGAATNGTLYRTGDTVVLYGVLFDNSLPITNATVTASVWNTTDLGSTAALGNFRLTSSVQIDSSTMQYTYAADVINNGAAMRNVTAELTGAPNGVTLVSNQLQFGDVPANGVVVSRHALRHRRRG